MTGRNRAAQLALVKQTFSISGGSQAGQPVIVDGEPPVDTNELDVNITVKSGYNICIGAYSRGIAGVNYTGTANITVGGDAVVSKLYLTPVRSMQIWLENIRNCLSLFIPHASYRKSKMYGSGGDFQKSLP